MIYESAHLCLKKGPFIICKNHIPFTVSFEMKQKHMCSSIKYDPDVWHQRLLPRYTGGEDPSSPNLQANDKMHRLRGGSACELAALWACITICLVRSKKKIKKSSFLYCGVLDEEVKAVSTRWLLRRPQGLHSGDPVCARCPGIKAAPLLFSPLSFLPFFFF